MIGQIISHYKILEKLGEGGMGVVYKAEDIKLKRIVALKFLPHEFTRDPQAKERFIHEAQAASKLQHNNICTIHDVDETDDGQIFISMDYYDGETLDKKIAQGQIEVDKVIDITRQIAQGLLQAHELGIVHRDIKPANIFITKDSVVKILDFGLAKSGGRTLVTREGTTLGTIAYMSPEQAQGETIDHRTDIWSLGVVMYEMLAGQRPFKSEYDQAIIYSILNNEPTPITHVRNDVAEELQQIIQTAMEKKAVHRYQHIDEFISDLQNIRDGERITKQTSRPKNNRAYWIAGIFLFTIIIAITFFKIFTKDVLANRKSIAVLPFTNLSDSKEDEYFSDGVTEDIITHISKISEIKVISRTSVMQYKGMKKSIVDIGKELNVATILEGSVRRSGNRIRIVGQLIDARTDEHLWADTFDREMKDVFDIQSDIAQRIASALRAKLSVDEKERIEKKPTDNLDAYTFYLKGREFYKRYRKQDNESAIILFKKAVELDRNYALAYAGIGDAYCERSDMFGFSNEWIDSAIVMSEKSIQLASNLAEGYKSLGRAYVIKGWNHKALDQYQKAIRYNPNLDDAMANIGWSHWHLGKYDEAITWLKKSLAYNPTLAFDYFGIGLAYMRLDDRANAEWWLNETSKLESDFIYAQLALCYLDIAQHQYQHALELSKKALEKFQNDPDVITTVADALLFSGDTKEAVRYYEKAINIDSLAKLPVAGVRPTTRLGFLFMKAGKKNEAQKLFDKNLMIDRIEMDQGSDAAFIAYDIAALNAIKNNSQEALPWLQKAIDNGWRDYRFSQQDPLFENLHNNPKFKQMIAQLKLNVEQMLKQTEKWERKN